MRNKLRLFASLVLLFTLSLIGLVALMIFTRPAPVLDADTLSPTAPVILSDKELTALWLTRTQLATYDPEGTRFWQRRTQMAIQATSTRSATPTFTPTPSDYTSCGWMWATQPNPALSAEIAAHLGGTSEITEFRAESFGENCLNSDGSIRGFAPMQTDYRLFTEVSGLPDDPAQAQTMLAPLVTDVLRILAHYPPDSTPGPASGILTIEFQSKSHPGGVGYWLSADYRQAIAALEQGLTGSALFDALGGLKPRVQIAPT